MIIVVSAACGGSGGDAAVSPPPPNTAPVVDAGTDATIRLPTGSVALDATVTDDGLPSNTLTYAWSVSSGPAGATFADTTAVDTTITFVDPGTYLLTLSASDSEMEASDTVQITVEAAPEVSTLSVTPKSVSLRPGGTQTFVATATDQYGDPYDADVFWSATGGVITQDGRFTAGSDAGDFMVTAAEGPIAASVTVTVETSAPSADAGGPYSGVQGAAIVLDASGSMDSDNDIAAYEWDLDSDALYDDARGVSVTFTANGAGVFTVGVRVTDAEGSSDTATTTVTVINLPPTAVSQSLSTPEDTTLPVILSGSDPGGDSLTCAVTAQPAHGILSGNEPQLAYTPDPDFNGSDSFTYIVSDGELDSPAATVSIVISPVNDAPTAEPQSASTNEDTALTLTLSARDPDGDSLSYSIVKMPSNGTLSGAPPTVTYTPRLDFSGSDGFSFTASDGVVESAAVSVSLTVDAVNDPPVAHDQSATTVASEAIALPLEYDDVDGPGPYTLQLMTAPKSGSLSPFHPDGSVIYTPDSAFTGSDRFGWVVNDGLEDSAEAIVSITVVSPSPVGIYFPPAGESLYSQSQKAPAEVGLSDTVVADLSTVITAGRWALWRHGYLVHVEGDFNNNDEVKSLRKIIHAATVGVAVQRGLVPSLAQAISVRNPELTGLDAKATWVHVMTQTSAFDEPSLAPGSLWAYSDANPLQLCRALARVWGRSDYTDRYDLVISDALFDAIGARGWSAVPAADGIRFLFDLEDLGRAGLLFIAGGEWNGNRLLPRWFVEELETKQTYGIPPDYDNENDGHTGLRVEDFPESPYGYMAWVNTDRDLYPNSSADWVVALGVGGHYLVYNRTFGLVFAMIDGDFVPLGGNPPGWPTPVRIAIEVLEQAVTGPNPLAEEGS